MNIYNFHLGNLVTNYIQIMNLLFTYDKSICQFHQPYFWYARLKEIDYIRHLAHIELINKITLSLERLFQEFDIRIKINHEKVYAMAKIYIFYALSHNSIVIDYLKPGEEVHILYPKCKDVFIE